MAMPEITPEKHAQLRQLHFDRKRVLNLGWLHSGTPVSSEQEDYEDFVEYRKRKAQPMSQPPPPAPIIVVMVPTDIPQLLYHTFSNIQASLIAYIGDNGHILLFGADVWHLRQPHTWPTTQPLSTIQGRGCLPTNLSSEPGEVRPSENMQRASEPAMVSAVKAPARIIEELHEPAPSEPDEVGIQEKENQGPELKSLHIFHPILESFCHVAVELHHESPHNWISRGLLNKSGINITATKYVAYKTQHGARLESIHRAKVGWKVSGHSKMVQNDFRIYEGDLTAPSIIIGKPILEVYGQDYFPNHVSSRSQDRQSHSKAQQRRPGVERIR